jgi:hypothetical protein
MTDKRLPRRRDPVQLGKLARRHFDGPGRKGSARLGLQIGFAFCAPNNGPPEMPLNIRAEWSKPVNLKLATSGAIYEFPDLGAIPETPGVYVFGRQHGNTITPLYIGRAMKLRRRLEQQFNSVILMSRIKESETGSRFLIFCAPILKPGQKAAKVITVMEDALIANALSNGYELLQKQGLKRPSHEITFVGNRTSEGLAPRHMRARASAS